MCMIATGLTLISAISGIFYFNKITLNEQDEDLRDKSTSLKKQNEKPIKPPRKSKIYPKLDEIDENNSSQLSRERCNTMDSTISNDQFQRRKLVRVQLENIPNKATLNNEEKLNSSKSLMPKNDINFVTNVNELKQSTIILENINDYAEKSVMRKTSNVRNKEVINETDTIYLSLPQNLDFFKDPILTSTKTNISSESNKFDNELTITKKYIYLINGEQNLSNDVSQILTIKIKQITSQNCYENNNNNNASSFRRSNSYHRRNENLETSSIKRQKKLSKLLLCYKK
ncbi:hypothetical protein M0804_007924 [Polistes exclamans]|nr:hypothetical protein M0804_007924 [Polistes exclamans]